MLVTNPFSLSYDFDRSTRSWWVLALSGVIGVVAGGIILLTDWSLGDLAVFLGAVLVFHGLSTAFTVPLDGSSRGWSIAAGLLEFAVGLMVWAWPSPTLLVLSFWLGWYVMLAGITAIAGAITGRGILPSWGLMLAIGIAEVLLSLWLLAGPGISLVVAVLALGLWAFVDGVAQIVIAFDLKRMRDQAPRPDTGLRAPSAERLPAPRHHLIALDTHRHRREPNHDAFRAAEQARRPDQGGRGSSIHRQGQGESRPPGGGGGKRARRPSRPPRSSPRTSTGPPARCLRGGTRWAGRGTTTWRPSAPTSTRSGPPTT